MSDSVLGAFARHAASTQSRRASGKALATAALVAVIRPTSAAAGKASKQAKKRCKRQGNGCRDSLAPNCEFAPDPEACLEQLDECCALIGKCQAGLFLECFLPLPETP